jgi:hypothetical protein
MFIAEDAQVWAAQEAATHMTTAVSARGYKIIAARQKPIRDPARKFFPPQSNRSG